MVYRNELSNTQSVVLAMFISMPLVRFVSMSEVHYMAAVEACRRVRCCCGHCQSATPCRGLPLMRSSQSNSGFPLPRCTLNSRYYNQNFNSTCKHTKV